MSSVQKIDLGLTGYDELFMSDAGRVENRLPKIYDIPLTEIDDFPDHPFKVMLDEDMDQLVQSIKERGIITPITLRQKEDGRYLFESAIDLMSYATLELFEGHVWRRDSLLSLAGVYKTKRKNVVPIALEQFLKDHPRVNTLRLHLDNDEIGRGAVAGIVSGLNGRFQVYDEPPACGKDVNDQLKMRVGIREKEAYCR